MTCAALVPTIWHRGPLGCLKLDGVTCLPGLSWPLGQGSAFASTLRRGWPRHPTQPTFPFHLRSVAACSQKLGHFLMFSETKKFHEI